MRRDALCWAIYEGANVIKRLIDCESDSFCIAGNVGSGGGRIVNGIECVKRGRESGGDSDSEEAPYIRNEFDVSCCTLNPYPRWDMHLYSPMYHSIPVQSSPNVPLCK